MATNYERLVKCTQEQLEFFFDSLVHKPASAYVDWAKWLGSEDPEAPYVGEEAFYLVNGEEKSCRYLEETDINSETHRVIYEVLPKGEVMKEALPAHLVRLATEETYPEEDPLRKLISNSVAEYTSEQNFSYYLYTNPGTNIEKTNSIPTQNKEVVIEELEIVDEESVLEDTLDELEIVEENELEDTLDELDIVDEESELDDTLDELDIVDEESELDDTLDELDIVDEESKLDDTLDELDIVDEENELEDTLNELDIVDEENELEDTIDELEIVDEPVKEEIVLTLHPELDEPVEEDAMAIDELDLPSENVHEDAGELTNKINDILNELENTDPSGSTIVIESLKTLEEEPHEDLTMVIEEVEEPSMEETINLDTVVEEEAPLEETIVIDKLEDLKEDTYALDDSAVLFTDNELEKIDDLEVELANFESTLSELESIVNDPGSSMELTNSHVLNMADTIQETEEDTDVELHDLLDDIKTRSTLFDPEDPEDRELPTIAFMAMNPGEDE